MAQILNFRPAVPERDADVRDSSETSSAEVIMFPGVRYEHWERTREESGAQSQQPSASASTSKTERSKTHRDVLELAE